MRRSHQMIMTGTVGIGLLVLAALIGCLASSTDSHGGTVTLEFSEALEEQAPAIVSINSHPGADIDKLEVWGKMHARHVATGASSFLKFLNQRGFEIEKLDAKFFRKNRTLVFSGESLGPESSGRFTALYGDWVNQTRRRAIESILAEYNASDTELKRAILPLVLEQSRLLIIDWHSLFSVQHR